MPITKSELAAKIRSSVPAFAGRSDDDLVSEYVKSYPDQALGITDWRPAGQAMAGSLPGIGGQANISSTPAGRVWDWAVNRSLLKDTEAGTQIQGVSRTMDQFGAMMPGIPGLMPPMPAGVAQGMIEAQTTPLALATAPLMAGRGVVQAAGKLGKYAPAALKALRGLDIGTNLAYGGQGIANVGNAVSDTSRPVTERLGQAGMGLLQTGMSAFGLRNPIVNKADMAAGATLSSAAVKEAADADPLQRWANFVRKQQAAQPPTVPVENVNTLGRVMEAAPQTSPFGGRSADGSFLQPGPRTQPIDPTLQALLQPSGATTRPTPAGMPVQAPNRLLEAAKGLPEAPASVPPTTVKATYIGDMGDDATRLRLYNITEGGTAQHPVNSTVSERALIEMGGTPAPAGAMPAGKPQAEASTFAGRHPAAQASAALVGPAAYAADPNDEYLSPEMKATLGMLGMGTFAVGRRNLTRGRAGVRPPVFFSRLAEAVKKLPDRIQAQSALSFLKKQPVHSEEFVFTGLEDMLQSLPPGQQISKRELEAFLDTNGLELTELRAGEPVPERLRAAAKRASETRDRALQATYTDDPVNSQRNFHRASVRRQQAQELRNSKFRSVPNPTRWQTYSYADDAAAIPDSYRESYISWKPKAVGPYKAATELPRVSSHSTDEANVVVWVRYHDRIDPATGKKVRFIDEIQSDWGQKGDKAGYTNPDQQMAVDNAAAVRQRRLNELQAEHDRLQGDNAIRRENFTPEVYERMAAIRNEMWDVVRNAPEGDTIPAKTQPNMPWKKSTMGWDVLGLKRILASAVEDGIDTVQWTTGRQQGERWPSTIHKVYADAKGRIVGDITNPNGELKTGVVLHPVQLDELDTYAEGSKLPLSRHLPQNWREKVLAGTVYEGGQVPEHITGKGFIEAYDERFTSWMDKYAKRFGGRVERGGIGWHTTGPADQAQRMRSQMGITAPVHSFTIPPQMAETIRSKGQELGFISPRLVNAVAGGAIGAATGAAAGGDTPEERLAAAAMLGTIGAVGGASFFKRQRPGVNVPSSRNLAKAQANVAPKVPNPLLRTTAERLGDQISEVVTDTYQPMNTGQKVVLRNIGKRLGQKVSLSPEDDAYLEIYRQMGGGESREAAVLFPFEDMVREVESAGASERFADYMNLQGLSHAAETTFPEHVQTLLAQHRKALLDEANARLAGRLGKAADYQEQAAAFRKQADDLLDALDKGELLPEGWNPQTLAADRATAMAQFSPEELKQFAVWEKAVRDLNQRSLELLGEVISPDTLARLQARTAKDPRYNPLLRILDHEDAIRWAMNNRSKNTDVVSLDNVMNYLEGSSRPTVHPLAASLRRFRAVVDRVERNRSSKAVFKLRETFNDAPEWDMLVKPVNKDNPLERGWAPLHFYDQGKRITYQVPTHIALSLKGMTDGDIQRVGWLYKLLRGSAKLSRFSAIMGNPAFVAANTVRDPGDAMLMARGVHFTSPTDQAKFAVELGRAWKDILKRDKSYIDDLLAIGGGNSGMTTALFPKVMGGSVLDQGVLGTGLRKMSAVSNASEMAPKLALARILKSKVDPKTGKRLWSDAAIASEVRNMGSPDFWRKGSIMASLGDWVFLLNGSIQGIARQSKYFHRPEKFAEALLGAAGIATATAKIAGSVKDSDGRPSIQRVSTDDLLNYIVIPTPWELTKQPDPRTGKKEPSFLKMPMPFGLKPFLIPLQLGLYNAMGLRQEDPEQILLSTVSTQLPGQFNIQADNKLGSFAKGAVASSTPIIRAGIEQLANADMGFDIPIESREDQKLPAVDRWAAGTSPLARLISQGLVAGPKAVGVEWEGISPKRVEHLMKKTGLRTGLLEPVAKGLDTAIAAAADMPTKPTPKWGEDNVGAARANPVLGMFARRFLGTGVDQTKRTAIDQLYDLYGKVSDTNAELISKAKTRPEELATLWRKPETAQRLAIFKVMQKIIPEFTKIHTQRTYILNHPDSPNRDQILKSLDETEARMLDALAPQLEIWTEQLKNPGKIKPQP